MKDKIFGVLQRVGRSFMLPIAEFSLLQVCCLVSAVPSQMKQLSLPMDCRRSWEVEHYLILF